MKKKSLANVLRGANSRVKGLVTVKSGRLDTADDDTQWRGPARPPSLVIRKPSITNMSLLGVKTIWHFPPDPRLIFEGATSKVWLRDNVKT
ncbi:hypothetical protein Bpfe_030615 [Biomphalaria pfeifferi]|uniref:Uncharacterized protein n=1 Tax=Biomphalaria pfeifferi TaxID=112525 RepID=A0AAD8AQA0_BIOPF|nr:hypothetical protein Bpfe_030615 [Biomphalaria pfeifferi]